MFGERFFRRVLDSFKFRESVIDDVFDQLIWDKVFVRCPGERRWRELQYNHWRLLGGRVFRRVRWQRIECRVFVLRFLDGRAMQCDGGLHKVLYWARVEPRQQLLLDWN